MDKYKEILELYEYCKEIDVEVTKEIFEDGYAIRFANGADFVQHRWSYGADEGYVEPAGVDKWYDYTAVSLKEAKELIKKYKDKLNKKKRWRGIFKGGGTEYV